MPKERYRLYHAEKAKGGIGLTMIGGSSVVAPDSPQAFGNILLYKDEVVPLARELADDVHAHGAAVMIQITHLGRRTSWVEGRLAAGAWRPRPCASRRTAPSRRRWRTGTSAASSPPMRTRPNACKAGGLDGLEIECYGHLIDQFWSPATNQRDDDVRRQPRQPHALRLRGAAAPSASASAPDFIVGTRLVCDEDWDRGLSRGGGAGDRAPAGGLGADRLRQRHPRPYRHRRGAVARHPRHGRALGAASRFRRRGAGGDRHRHLPRRPHPGRRDRAARHRDRQARHGRHDARPHGRPAYRAQGVGGPRGRDPALRRHGLLHRFASTAARRCASTMPPPAARRRCRTWSRRRRAAPQGRRGRRGAGRAGGGARRGRARPRGGAVRGGRRAGRAGAGRRRGLERRREIMGIVDWRSRNARSTASSSGSTPMPRPPTCWPRSPTSSWSRPAACPTPPSSTPARIS